MCLCAWVNSKQTDVPKHSGFVPASRFVGGDCRLHIAHCRFHIAYWNRASDVRGESGICNMQLAYAICIYLVEISKICAAGDDDNQSQREWSPSVLVPAAHSKNCFPRVALQTRVLSDGQFRAVGTFPTSRNT